MEFTDSERWISSASLLMTLPIPNVTDLMIHNRMQAPLWLHRVFAVPAFLATASHLTMAIAFLWLGRTGNPPSGGLA